MSLRQTATFDLNVSVIASDLPCSESQFRLLQCLADGQFHSGADLAERLGLTRAAVWKQMHGLESLGIAFHSVAGKGYKLVSALDLLDSDQILSGIAAKSARNIAALQVHPALDSTNAHLLRLPAVDPGKAIVCLAEMQTAGRGRQGRRWISPLGASIYLSLLWRFDEGPAALGGLSLAVGVAAVRALRRCGVEAIGLKWPNDLLWRNRKLGGVLIEVVGESHGPCRVVVGLGLNVSVPRRAGEQIDQDWVDLAEICSGRPPSRNLLSSLLVEEMVDLLCDYAEKGLTAYLPEWRGHNCVLNQPVRLQLVDRSETGVVRDVTEEGLLMLEHQDGSLKSYASGEVSLRLVDTAASPSNSGFNA